MASLGKDLAAIRSNRNLSIEEVQQITRVPQHILRSIEDDSILAEIHKNTTYTRSYVRSYAKAVGIKEQDIVRALDDVENGTYEGSLNPSATSSLDEAGQSNDTTKEQAQSGKKRKQSQTEKTPTKKEQGPQPDRKKSYSSGSVSAVDWVDVGRKAKPVRSKSRVWSGLLIIILLAAILAAIFLVYHYYSTGSDVVPPPQENPTAIQPQNPSDSLRESLIRKENLPATTGTTATAEGTLADTLSIAIYAANGKLEPVRVYTDILGKQNPYWVPQGDTIRFNFVNTVRIRAVNQYDRFQLLFNGHVITNFYQQYFNPESGMVELERAVFEDRPQWSTPAGQAIP